MRNGNRTAGLGRKAAECLQDGVTHEFTGAELDLIRRVMPAHEVGHSDAKRWVDENYGDV
jgi:hypothetical protein